MGATARALKQQPTLAISDEEAAKLVKAERAKACTCKVKITGAEQVVAKLRDHGGSFRFIADHLTGRGIPMTYHTVQRHVEQRCACFQ